MQTRHLALLLFLGACTVNGKPRFTLDGPTATEPSHTADGTPNVAPPPPVKGPPAVRLDADTVQGPGGPLSDEQRECTAAHDHCLRSQWFVTGYSNHRGSRGMQPVFEFEGKWYLWTGKRVTGGTLYRTTRATASTLKVARQVLAYWPPENELTPRLPVSEREAMTSDRWSALIVSEIDAATGTFTSDGVTHQIDAARVISDPVGL